VKEKNFVVVGGSSGIGLEMVNRLSTSGHGVTVVSRTWPHAESLPEVRHVSMDVTKDDLDSGALPEAISGLVYCPGTIRLRSFRGLSPQDFHDDYELNVVGAVRCIQGALKGMKAADAASIVLFSTIAAQTGLPLHASIAAAKAGLEAMGKTLAAELSPGIRVNCIAPALVDSPLSSRFFGDPEKEKALASRYPMQRTGTIDDIASMAMYLLTDGPWITGQVYGVDGGMSTIRK